MAKNTYYGKTVLKEPKHQPAPRLTIEQVLDIAEKEYKKTGHYPSYGKVVQHIESGKIKVGYYLRWMRAAIK